jgi:hypothetical protein
MKAYLLVFNLPLPINREAVTNFLESRPEIRHWITCFTHGLIVISDSSPTQLRQLINGQFPGLWFLIDQIDPWTVDGWAPQIVWEWIKNPTRPVTPIE